MLVAAVNSSPTPPDALRSAFDQFVGETFYGQMMAAMRKTTGKAPYFHGGRAEEIFQSQFDQVIAQRLSESNAHTFTGPMFRQFVAETNSDADRRLPEISSAAAQSAPSEAADQTPPWAGLLGAQRR